MTSCDYGLFMKYLCIQIQVCKLSITDSCHCLAVHCEVHLATVALDGDIVPVEIIEKAADSQCNATIDFVYHTVS